MRFSCIIPAFNEGPRIAKVLETVLACEKIDEIIVIDDGSTDNTREIIKSFIHPKLIKKYLENNSGKLNAFFIGFSASSGDYIFMLDADYSGFQTHHISTLIKPIREGKVGSTMMMWYESLFICKLLKHDIFSGTRVLPRTIFDDSSFFLSGYGFGLEAKINEKLFQNKISILSFYFPEVHNPKKGWRQLLWKQPRDILRSISIWKLLRQAYYIYRQQP